MVTRHHADGRTGTIENFLAIMRLWLAEVRGELAEAVSILSSDGLCGNWWADQVRKNLECNDGPSAEIADIYGANEPATLLEIAFWSGWLKGEKDTMERITRVANEIQESPKRAASGSTLASFGLKMSGNGRQNEEAAVATMASEIVAEIEKRNYRPETEMISISLSAAIDSGRFEENTLALETISYLDDFVANGSSASLTMLSFNCGLLAGKTIQAARNRAGSGFIVGTGGEEGAGWH